MFRNENAGLLPVASKCQKTEKDKHKIGLGAVVREDMEVMRSVRSRVILVGIHLFAMLHRQEIIDHLLLKFDKLGSTSCIMPRYEAKDITVDDALTRYSNELCDKCNEDKDNGRSGKGRTLCFGLVVANRASVKLDVFHYSLTGRAQALKRSRLTGSHLLGVISVSRTLLLSIHVSSF